MGHVCIVVGYMNLYIAYQVCCLWDMFVLLWVTWTYI